MRRADRLYRLLATLRRRRTATAQQLAEHLECSVRTVYRDIADLVESGVPIRGEAGVGYRLERSADLPPVNLDIDEIQALVFGARLVERAGDPSLRAAARSAMDKLAAALPEAKGAWLERTAVFATPRFLGIEDLPQLGLIRRAIDARRALHITYADRSEVPSERDILPLGLWFWKQTWTVAAWCELRAGYRNFRVDRLLSVDLLERTFPEQSPYTVADFQAAMNEEG